MSRLSLFAAIDELLEMAYERRMERELTLQAPDQSCGFCRWWHETTSFDDKLNFTKDQDSGEGDNLAHYRSRVGLCKRFPPSIAAKTGGGRDISLHQPTREYDECGEWEVTSQLTKRLNNL